MRCQAIQINGPMRNKRCGSEQLTVNARGQKLCWVHAAAVKNPHRGIPLTVVTTDPPEVR